ncbi:MAG: hypothetical protein C4519_00460 [Desulfobacteraceae bacterium]|nr:MAG: hypothetical protein C4519_00460 [Desulfobacteraceae bacterium]
MPDGTVRIHGRDYKTVALRMSEFRAEYPMWSIETEIVRLDDDRTIVRARIIDDAGRLISTGHAEEWRQSSQINETSMVENAETSAVGRALAFFKFAGSEIASADEVATAQRKASTLPPRDNGKSASHPTGRKQYTRDPSKDSLPISDNQFKFMYGKFWEWLKGTAIPGPEWQAISDHYVLDVTGKNPQDLTRGDLAKLVDVPEAQEKFLQAVTNY